MKKQRHYKRLAIFHTIVIITIIILLALKIQYILLNKENYTVTVLETGEPIAAIDENGKEIIAYEILGEKEVANHGEIILRYILDAIILLPILIAFLINATGELLEIRDKKITRNAAKDFYSKRKQYHKKMLKYKNK